MPFLNNTKQPEQVGVRSVTFPKADRFNSGKPKISYLLDCPLAMEGLVSRFEMGANKYGRDNWKGGLDDKELIDSLLRHLLKYSNGSFNDEADGGYHVDAIVWNAVVLSEQFHKRRTNGEKFV